MGAFDVRQYMRCSMIPAKSLKFRAAFAQKDTFGLVKVCEVEFTHGLGPCGRHVTDLRYEIADGLLTIKQWSRHPDDLGEPTEGSEARWLLEADNQKARLEGSYPGLILTTPDEPRTFTTGFLWWRKTVVIPAEPLPEPPPKPGRLTTEQRTELRKQFSDYCKAHDKWVNAVEIKEFVYKLSDIQGRIETLK